MDHDYEIRTVCPFCLVENQRAAGVMGDHPPGYRGPDDDIVGLCLCVHCGIISTLDLSAPGNLRPLRNDERWVLKEPPVAILLSLWHEQDELGIRFPPA